MFDAAVNAFDRVETGKAYGKDYQEAALSLATLQLRLARWGNTIKIVDDASQETSGLPVAPAEDTEVFEDLLGSIARNFEDAEKVAKRHKLKATSTVQSSPADGSNTIDELEKKVRGLTLQRQRSSSVGQKARWVFHDKKYFGEIITSLTRQVTEVIELFPADVYQAQQQALEKYAQDDAQQLSKATEVIQPSEIEEPEDAAVALLKATERVDPQLKDLLGKIAEQKTGHRFGKLTMQDKARAIQGLQVTGDYRGPTNITDGHSHSYGDVNMSGESRIQQGTILGGKSIWDD